MLKKGICFFSVMIAATLAFGIYRQRTMDNIGLFDVHNVEDLDQLSVKVKGFAMEDSDGYRLAVDGENMKHCLKEQMQGYLNCSYAVVGKATGNLQLHFGSTAQEVTVEKVINLFDGSQVTGNNGLAAKGENIWITSSGGLIILEAGSWGEDERYIAYDDMWINLMEKGDEYLIFVQDNAYNKYLPQKSYCVGGELFYEYFNLAPGKAFAVDVTEDNAQLSDFKGTEVVTNQEEEVEFYLKLKEMLLETCGIASDRKREAA